ncbi:uncharacterized protein LOC110870103 [Helianthus annuus]|uniref:uncharacterized protein LOC110870103 n=1 Tax=Helianthus annuus TaxID=4232 RepID=UPI0016533143|nr:uncharacterized protein LOC110870103 [Helianthus annuus]
MLQRLRRFRVAESSRPQNEFEFSCTGRLFRLEGIIPALETSHALTYLEKLCPTKGYIRELDHLRGLLMQIRIQKKQLTVTHMKVSWLVMGLGMTVTCVSKSLVYVLSNKIGRRARVYAFFLFLFFISWKTSFFTSFWPE